MQSQKMLSVAQMALNMMLDCESKEQMKVLWVAAITSLRAVGHVLHNVDSHIDLKHKEIIDRWWMLLQKSKESAENQIFFYFIELERNDTIKEFSLHYDTDINDLLILEDGCTAVRISDLTDSLLYIPMTEGPFEGEDIRDLLSSGIEWWKEQFVLMGI